jgi:hypothetical protein
MTKVLGNQNLVKIKWRAEILSNRSVTENNKKFVTISENENFVLYEVAFSFK